MQETMLIVDDNEMNRAILTQLFQNDFAIREAAGGAECLAMLAACQYQVDVVLLDIVMPQMSGLEVLRRRQEMAAFRGIPVIVITASDEVEDQVRAFSLGANDFINKPFVPEIALSRVNNVLTANRRLRTILLEKEQFRSMAELDRMTNLYNKFTTERIVGEVLSCRPRELHALFVIDIDNFKAINDKNGHLTGDHTIRIVADLISSQFRQTDIVGRVGGDEYLVLMTGVPNREIARQKAMMLIRLMKYKPNLTIPANVSLSIGLAFSNQEEMSYQQLFEKADRALYRAKQLGRARYTEYGVEEVQAPPVRTDAVILISRDRQICGMVADVLRAGVQLVELDTVEELAGCLNQFIGKIAMVYVDVTDEADDGAPVWNTLAGFDCLKGVPLLALCREGDMAQYRTALLAGAADMLSVPLEMNALKRRSLFHLKKQDG